MKKKIDTVIALTMLIIALIALASIYFYIKALWMLYSLLTFLIEPA